MKTISAAHGRRIALLVLAAGLAGCGGGGGDSAPAPAPRTATPTAPQAPKLVLTAVGPTDLGTLSRGFRSASPLKVQVTDTRGNAVNGETVTWETDDPTSWTTTSSTQTGPFNDSQTYWVAGTRPTATITARVRNAAGEATATFTARTQAAAAPISPPSRWNIYLDTAGGEVANALRATATIENEGPVTYFSTLNWYSATAGVSGGYMGLQRDGSRYRSQLQFSVWDGLTTAAAIIRATAPGVVCGRFGGEGGGVKCELDYPWAAGETFVFEVQEQVVAGASQMTAFVTRQSTGARTEVATLQQGQRALLNQTSVFIEVFGSVPTEDSCDKQVLRSLRIDAPQYRVGSTWKPFKSGEAIAPDPAAHCANSAFTPLVGGGFKATAGGATRGSGDATVNFNL